MDNVLNFELRVDNVKTDLTSDEFTVIIPLIKEEKGHGLIRNNIDLLVLSSSKQCLGLIVICDMLKLFWETTMKI